MQVPMFVRAAAMAVFASSFVSAQVFEDLGGNYEKLRGVNFVANYPSLNGHIGNPAAPFPYYGVASPTAMWKFYDENGATSAAVAQQLDWVKQTGFNAVRVFLSYPAWLHYRANPPAGVTGNAFILRFKHFVSLCYARGIYVMPVLWDGVAVHGMANSCSVNPDYSDPIGDIAASVSPNGLSNISYWHRNPGQDVIDQILAEDALFELSMAGIYIEECVSVFHDPTPGQDYSQALLMWDVMNEGQCGDIVTWVERSLDTIKLYTPNDPTTWGWVVRDDIPETVELATYANCDVISLHIYNHRIGALESHLYDASYITGHSTWPTPYGKPVILTEIGHPGFGYSYQDAIEYCQNAKRYGDSGLPGIGFMPWQFSIGFRDNAANPVISGNMPFSRGQGMFYFDGEVRDLDVVQDFVGLAVQHGVSTGLFGQGGIPWPTEKAPTDRYFVPPDALVPLAEEALQDALMSLATAGIYSAQGIWTWKDYLDASELFRSLVVLGTWPNHTSTTNNNPWAWPSSTLPGYVEFSTLLYDYADQSLAGSPEWWVMIAQLEQQYMPSAPAGWLQPWVPPPANPDQQLHIDVLVYGFLRLFALEAGTFLVDR